MAYNYNYSNHINNVYPNKPGTVEYKRFSEEYFAGQDVRIYFGDVWVDEIVSMQFTMMENVAPIFGYASYTYDTVARGSRQIQGSFRINFKESYYLHFITNRLDSKLEALSPTGQFIDDGVTKITKAIPKENITVDHLISKMGGSNDTQFEDLALEFEKSLWGDSNNSDMTERTENRSEHSYFYPEKGRPNLAKHGFNIMVLYGPYQEAGNGTREQVATTAHTLTGVHLTGVSQVIDGSGQPVYEDYSFIARDLDGPMNSYSSSPVYNSVRLPK